MVWDVCNNRLCVFGEHSDWAGTYRVSNPDIARGCAIVVGTHEGLYAHVIPHDSKLIMTSTLNDGKYGNHMAPGHSLCRLIIWKCVRLVSIGYFRLNVKWMLPSYWR
jgi:hypothetical protein